MVAKAQTCMRATLDAQNRWNACWDLSDVWAKQGHSPQRSALGDRKLHGIATALRRCCERVVPLYNPCTSLIYPLYIPCSLLGLSACLRSRHRAPRSYRPPRSGGYSNEVKGHAPEPARRRQPEAQGFRLLDTIDVTHAFSG